MFNIFLVQEPWWEKINQEHRTVSFPGWQTILPKWPIWQSEWPRVAAYFKIGVRVRYVTYISHHSWKQNKSVPSTVNTTTFHVILLLRVHRLDIYLQLLGLRTSISSQDQEQGCQHYLMLGINFFALPNPGNEVEVILVWIDLHGRAFRMYWLSNPDPYWESTSFSCPIPYLLVCVLYASQQEA